MKARETLHGFSLLELSIVISLITILILVGLPAMNRVIARARQQNEIDRLIRAIQYARGAALGLGHDVMLCPSADHQHCSGQWQQGMIVMDLHDHEVLQVFPAFSHQVELTWLGSLDKKQSLRFLPTGLSAQQGHFCYQSKRMSGCEVTLVVNRSGRVHAV